MAAGETAAADHHMRVDRVSSRPKKVLIVVANPTTSTTLGWPVGFWGAELAHPYFELTQRGVAVTIASPDGGKVEMDSLSDPRDGSKWSAATCFLITCRRSSRALSQAIGWSPMRLSFRTQ